MLIAFPNLAILGQKWHFFENVTLAISSIQTMRNIVCGAKKFVFDFSWVEKTTKVLLAGEGGGIRKKS